MKNAMTKTTREQLVKINARKSSNERYALDTTAKHWECMTGELLNDYDLLALELVLASNDMVDVVDAMTRAIKTYREMNFGQKNTAMRNAYRFVINQYGVCC